MPLAPHGREWYDRLATLQDGYYYPWKSYIPENNGEDSYIKLVKKHLAPSLSVLDVGCGHGELTLEFAPFCKSITGYDRVKSYIDIAKCNTDNRKIENAQFLYADPKDAKTVVCKIPVPSNSFDLIISRRGPLHWIDEAKRISRPNSCAIQLNPAYSPPPAWDKLLPEKLKIENSGRQGPKDIKDGVKKRLINNGLKFKRFWHFDKPEYFSDTENLYRMLAWGKTASEVPAYGKVKDLLTDIFQKYSIKNRLEVRFGRFLWMAKIG
jgi:23S rRNA (guanine745-N1)-methyltransferase